MASLSEFSKSATVNRVSRPRDLVRPPSSYALFTRRPDESNDGDQWAPGPEGVVVQLGEIHPGDLTIKIEGVGAIEAIPEQGTEVMEIDFAIGDREDHPTRAIHPDAIAHIPTFVVGDEAWMKLTLDDEHGP